MKLRTIALAFSLPLLAFSASAVTTRVLAQDEMLAKPTKQHALLERWVGTWNATFDMPAAGVSGSKAVLERKLVGKLWIVDDYRGELMGLPFHGHGITGYDPEKQKFVGAWVDAWTDRMVTLEGTYDEATKTLRCEVPGKNPMTGEDQIEIHETKVIDDDTQHFRMLWPGEGGEYFEAMTIRYERKK